MKININKRWNNTTIDVLIYNGNKEIINWFSYIDVWGSKGYDRFNDGGIYFEIPSCMYDVIEELPFIAKYNISVIKRD